MSFRSFVLAACLTLFGCSRPAQTNLPPAVPAGASSLPAAALPVQISGPAWTAQLPVGWVSVPPPDKEPPNTCEAAGKSLRLIGMIPMFFIVNSTTWDETKHGSIDRFPVTAAIRLESSALSLKSRTASFAGEHAVVSVGSLMNGMAVMQVAAAHNGRGYVLRCAGDPDKTVDIVARCMAIWSSFKFKE